jgi:hypothetical protein
MGFVSGTGGSSNHTIIVFHLKILQLNLLVKEQELQSKVLVVK